MTQFPALNSENTVFHLRGRDIVRPARALSGGYYVEVLVAPHSSDDMWETVHLPAIYRSLSQVEAKVAAVKARGKIDLRFWAWTPSKSSSWNFMQYSPIAQVQEVPLRDVSGFAD